ncbi:Quinol monooxygenase YgiN [Geoalkalibacter ferrihydriticus]|uniref:Antibiotic biosynthesis monooxygenase n=2 Tax=Geoalkalibacter ferrihydriticus TaxID=392333 RepID=A0A0C2HW42_9BACT|nr:antibiotic biosynthesis monooxygenase [Geoalkalibacter ferrihydriticus]KIH76992.1 antibiotic biosynthesis monooxygenase [Geoalkalibacter ferrihydriticus DSM 17813]SDL40446.1 Quinol monooxygenase YgiN [Geoalkalibacter ferrihydriticus]
MIDVSITLKVPPEKRKEILQTLRAVLGPIRQERGCVSCHCYIDIEADNRIFFREEWKISEDLDTHLQFGHFGVLLGAMKLLPQEPEIRVNTVSSTAGAETPTR